MIKNFYKLIFILLAFLGLSISAMAQINYEITGNGTKFNVKGPLGSVATGVTIKAAIAAIKLDAQGMYCLIRFGNGNSTIDLGTENIWFGDLDSDPHPWYNPILLQGKLTSENTLCVIGMDHTSIISYANITSFNKGTVFDVYESSLTIYEGTITATNGIAVANYGRDVIINNATVKATGYYGIAIYNDGQCVTTIENGAKVTSDNDDGTRGTIYVKDGTVDIKGGIVENTATDGIAINNNYRVSISGGTVSTTNPFSTAIINNSTGTVEISGGSISVAKQECNAIRNEIGGTLIIENGTISAEGVWSNAIYNKGKLTINNGTIKATGEENSAINNNGGTLKISGGTISSTDNTISTSGTLNMSGGVILTTSDNGNAVFNSGHVGVYGGMILAKKGYAISSTGTTSMDFGGILFAYGTKLSDVLSEDDPEVINGAAIIAWNKDAGNTTYEFGTSNDIFKFPTAATVVWAKEGSNNGISVDAADKGFIPIEGITITGVGIEELQVTSDELQVYPNPTTGELRVTSDELQVTSIEVFDIYGRTVSTHYSLLTTHYSMDISHLANGIYFLKIQTEKGMVMKKIVKQ
ncbi:MAG: T9SS type A sorting domain-containing protein [Bacteroidales bacterium]|jgi:hypothetical protein|nr:T9SS type A sorting domain-containing protein [Bacteroidales bacterium]